MTLCDWVAEKYAGRFIPISGEPYFNHCLAVAVTAGKYTPLGYEAGLCHDMLEDKIVTAVELRGALIACGYTKTGPILTLVTELSDVYTPEEYPELPKKERRRLENARLSQVSAAAQTVKYADLIDNAGWVRRYEPQKWARYARRKSKLLRLLDQGDPTLRQEALRVLSIPEFF